MLPPGTKIPKGLPGLRDWLRELRAFAIQSQPVRSETCEVHQTDSGTQILPLVRKGGSAAFFSFPFQILPGGSANSVKVSLNSFLLKDADPTSKITITGLDSAFAMSPGQRIWLEVNLSATYSETPGPITASIQHGAAWGVGFDYYPIPVQYDTDDGTRLSSTGNPPDNSKQTKFFIPIAYCTSKESDAFNLVAKGFAFAIGDDAYVIQQCSTHLMIGSQCIDGGQVVFAMPSPFAPQAD